MSIQKYPIGLQDFKEVITRGCVFVDKTPFVHRIIDTHKYYFLSRPRRFGKSLLISTFDYLFRGHRELFKGLYIEDKWTFEEYPVIRISFSEIGYRTGALSNAIEEGLAEIASTYGIKLEKSGVGILFRELIQSLYKKYNKQVVVLIDEYDKPLIDYLSKDDLHKALENRSILKSFYSILKDADPYLKMVFITGVSKFTQVSIFSDLNNLNDLTLDLEYNAICGISQTELEQNFTEELKLYDKDKIKEWYNGYKWDVDAETVYNPFSLLNFFNKNGKFMNFWYTTGTPTFLMKMSREKKMYQFEEIEFDYGDLQNFDIENIKTIPLLFQGGYLTIIGYNATLNNVRLSFPNIEVKESYLRGLTDVYIYSEDITSKSILDSLLKALRSKDALGLERAINSAFAQIPYDLWQKENEHFYHAIVHLLFSLLGVYIHSEVHTQYGRADALIIFEDHIYCLEFKLNKSAQDAIDQIEKTGYVDQYKDSGKTIHKIGINFSSEGKKVDGLIWE